MGKRVEHLVKHDKDAEEWWKGTFGSILSRRVRRISLLIKYYGFHEKYEFRFSDYKKGMFEQ